MPLPSSVSVRDWPLWFETVISTGPAPTFLGEIVTFSFVITPVSSSVTGGRGLLAKSFPPPQPASASATMAILTVTRRMRTVGRMTLIPRRGNLPKPDRSTTCDELIDFTLDLPADSLGNRLHEREVVGVLGAILIQRNGFKEANLEFRRQIHCAGREPGPRKRVIDGEVDEPRQALERAHVREDRHGLLGSDDRHRHDRDTCAQCGLDEATASEPAQAITLPVDLPGRLLALGEHEREPPLVTQQALRISRMGGDQPDLVRQHADARVALEPVLAEHVDGPRVRVLVPDRLHDHRRVRRQRAREIRDQQRAARAGYVLDALLLDPEPVLVIEVENRLDEREERLRAAPVVDVARQVLGRDQLRALLVRWRSGTRARKFVDVRARVEFRLADAAQNGSSTT